MVVDPDVATNWLEFTIAVFSLLLVLAGVVTAANRVQERKIKQMIKDATYPISRGGNGGLSLPDVARNVDSLMKSQQSLMDGQHTLGQMIDQSNQRVHESLGKVHARLDGHIDDHVKGTFRASEGKG